MNVELFIIEGKQVKASPHCYTIPKLKAIIDNYPDNYTKLLPYIFYVSYIGPQNPFSNLQEDSKEEIIAKALELDFSLDSNSIQEAIEFCKKLYETPTVRAYRGFQSMLDNLADYMENTKIEAGRDGNLSALIQAAKSFSAVRESFKALEKDVEEEQNDKRARGGQKLAYDQKG